MNQLDQAALGVREENFYDEASSEFKNNILRRSEVKYIESISAHDAKPRFFYVVRANKTVFLQSNSLPESSFCGLLIDVDAAVEIDDL